jgi:hypothetical protein
LDFLAEKKNLVPKFIKKNKNSNFHNEHYMLLLSIYDNNNLGRNLLLLHYINIYNAYNIANKECVDIEVEFIYLFFFFSINYLFDI